MDNSNHHITKKPVKRRFLKAAFLVVYIIIFTFAVLLNTVFKYIEFDTTNVASIELVYNASYFGATRIGNDEIYSEMKEQFSNIRFVYDHNRTNLLDIKLNTRGGLHVFFYDDNGKVIEHFMLVRYYSNGIFNIENERHTIVLDMLYYKPADKGLELPKLVDYMNRRGMYI